jgi:hypothetical protein
MDNTALDTLAVRIQDRLELLSKTLVLVETNLDEFVQLILGLDSADVKSRQQGVLIDQIKHLYCNRPAPRDGRPFGWELDEVL